jgi:hypothetical protein
MAPFFGANYPDGLQYSRLRRKIVCATTIPQKKGGEGDCIVTQIDCNTLRNYTVASGGDEK